MRQQSVFNLTVTALLLMSRVASVQSAPPTIFGLPNTGDQ